MKVLLTFLSSRRVTSNRKYLSSWVRKIYIFDKQHQNWELHAHGGGARSRKGDVVIENVASAKLEDRKLEIWICDPFDMTVANWLARRVPLDYHLSNSFSMGWLLPRMIGTRGWKGQK